MATKYETLVFDFETDPFKFGRVPQPFALEVYGEDVCEVFWGDDCVAQFLSWLERQTRRFMMYAHNGGKFDFHFLHAALENPIRVINSRIVHASIGRHVIRDSLAILPVPLRKFGKDDIDYRKLERPVRETHKAEILSYLHTDCTSLYRAVSAFVARFGPKLTVGKTAIDEIIKRHEFEIMSPAEDAVIRPFYYGGRVECFRTGILEGPFLMLDLNSAYSKAMRDYNHPFGSSFHELSTMPDDFDTPFFIEFTGSNKGALPIKTDDGALSFNEPYGRFHACSHELQVALQHDLVKIDKVHRVYLAQGVVRFVDFVDTFYAEKTLSRMNGDDLNEWFAKFMLNSGYGKFGQSPDNFRDWFINRDFGNDTTLLANDYVLEAEYEEFELWSRPAAVNKSCYYNVGIAASVTSATRSILLQGIQDAVDPIYCDTDSLLCRDFRGAISATDLGAWKLEKTAPFAAIAGKKQYALYDPETLKLPKTLYNKEWRENEPNPARRPLKISSKGGKLTVDDIIALCGGSTVRYLNDAPTFNLHGEPRFIARNFRMTGEQIP